MLQPGCHRPQFSGSPEVLLQQILQGGTCWWEGGAVRLGEPPPLQHGYLGR